MSPEEAITRVETLLGKMATDAAARRHYRTMPLGNNKTLTVDVFRQGW